MGELIVKINEAFAVLDEGERGAYSAGMSHVYSDVFEIFGDAFRDGLGLHEVFERLRDRWDYVRDIQVVKGVL